METSLIFTGWKLVRSIQYVKERNLSLKTMEDGTFYFQKQKTTLTIAINTRVYQSLTIQCVPKLKTVIERNE